MKLAIIVILILIQISKVDHGDHNDLVDPENHILLNHVDSDESS